MSEYQKTATDFSWGQHEEMRRQLLAERDKSMKLFSQVYNLSRLFVYDSATKSWQAHITDAEAITLELGDALRRRFR